MSIDKINGLIKTNVTELATSTKNVIIRYLITSRGLMTLEPVCDSILAERSV